MGYVNSNLARKVGKLVGWREKIWSRRYQAIVISSEEVAQVERLKYVLAQDYASYCTSFECASSTRGESIWYRKTPGATESERTLPSATHW
jgi:hypothetical protein